jgi:acyl-CoA thioesterase I
LAEARKDIRIVILGDSRVGASGDERGMGWVGRVTAKTPAAHPRIDIFALPAPAENTSMLAERWVQEVQRRFSPETDNRLVLALPNIDLAAGISTSRSRLNVATILDEAAKAGISCLLVGPWPSHNPQLNADIEHLVAGFEDVANRRGVTFIDCFRPLVDHPDFNSELASAEHGRPGQIGHGLVAWLVLNRGWYEWLGIESPE